jgi:hypothetical protein
MQGFLNSGFLVDSVLHHHRSALHHLHRANLPHHRLLGYCSVESQGLLDTFIRGIEYWATSKSTVSLAVKAPDLVVLAEMVRFLLPLLGCWFSLFRAHQLPRILWVVISAWRLALS